jgi:hypothetical protein
MNILCAGVCDKVQEQHGKHLPMMNGIKEDIKTLLTLELGSPLFHEVLVNLAVRLKALQVHALFMHLVVVFMLRALQFCTRL